MIPRADQRQLGQQAPPLGARCGLELTGTRIQRIQITAGLQRNGHQVIERARLSGEPVVHTALVELREQIEAHNAAHPTPERYTQVVLYVGQCLIQQDQGGSDEA